MDLSIIIPIANEYPQILFTLQSLFCELTDSGIEFEVIVVDNWCEELKAQGRIRDRGGERVQSLVEKGYTPWIKYVEYSDKLSHWNAKNAGVRESTGDILLFVDGHCVPSKNSIVEMYHYYKAYHSTLDGTLHLPISYMLDKSQLIYKLNLDGYYACYLSYQFKHHKPQGDILQVPVMSSCGMMITRDLMINTLRYWPEELGIYQGGEHYVCFTLALLGKTMNVFPTDPIYHYADKRGYEFNWTDLHRNRTLSVYLTFGREGAERYMHKIGQDHGSKQSIEICNNIAEWTTSRRGLIDRRTYIKENAVMSPQQYVDYWLDTAPDLVRKEKYMEQLYRNKLQTKRAAK